MSVTDFLRWVYGFMEHPWVLLLVIPAFLLIVWLLRRDFIAMKEDVQTRKQRKRLQRIMLLTRTVMVLLVLVALASPYIQSEKIIDGDPFVQVLVDNSTSMSVFEDVSGELVAALKNKVNTEVKSVGSGTVSNIGDAVLNNLQPHSSIVLLSDGSANAGADLGEVALFASKLNASVNAISLSEARNDASVQVFGPSKLLEDSEGTFTVLINRVSGVKSVNLKVTLDGETVVDESTSKNSFQFTRQLSQGTHRITARIDSPDFFPNNNVFFKTVKVVPKPKVLYYGKQGSPLEQLLKQVYVVESVTSLPSALSPYYALVVNDVAAGQLDPVSDVLNDFVADGNGMVVFGGENAYERGEYRNSVFETLLPVQVGAPEKEEGDVLVAIVIDISGSQGAAFGRFESTADFSKAATIDILRNVKVDTRVAILAFNTQAYLLSEPSPAFSKKGIEDVIARLKWGGGTNIAAGLLKATGVLGSFTGSKNIVLLSDGKTQGKASATEAAKFAYNNGIKIYTVGVGPTTDEEFMMSIADITNGIYFRATEETKLRLIFGDADEQEAESGLMELVVLNDNHFITARFEPSATLYGFNQVSPKNAGRMLATTSTGEPILTVWRLGLGRVAAFSTDDGSKWAGSLLGEANSQVITRTMNWAIGDPERKSASFIDVTDTRINEPADVTVRSSTPPTAEGVAFYKIDEDTYSGSILPESTGFQEVAGAPFAVNYEREFGDLGVSDELGNIVASTGGKIFDVDDVDGMVKQAKSRARRVINSRDYIRAPFIVLAIIIFLLEIFIRRIMRRS